MARRNVIRIAVLATAVFAVLTVTSRLIGAGAPGPAVPAAAELGGTGYIVGAYDGRIALFTDEFNETPAVETDIDIMGLRAYDRQLLMDGIKVETYDEVLRLIEDFNS